MTEEGMLGTVAVLRRYPVKSMLGEDLQAGDVTGRGLAGDRVLALVHRETGKVASAKNPRLWRGLLKLAATASGPVVKITLPDDTAMTSTDPGVDDVLSGLLGQPVTLTATPPARAVLDRADPEEVLRNGLEAQVQVEVGQLGGASPEGTFFDFAPLHLITTSALERIAGLSPRGTVERERYRPNIVIRTTVPGFVENDWTGRDLRIGSDLIIRVLARTPAAPSRPWNTATCRATSPHCGYWPTTTGSGPWIPSARSRAPGSTPRFSAPAESSSATSCTGKRRQ